MTHPKKSGSDLPASAISILKAATTRGFQTANGRKCLFFVREFHFGQLLKSYLSAPIRKKGRVVREFKNAEIQMNNSFIL